MMPATAGLRLFGVGALFAVPPGVSEEALQVARRLSRLAQGILQSATGQSRIGDPASELVDVMGQCAIDDWDGQGASAIPVSAFHEAWLILCLLPSSIPVPKVLPEPTGAIALEWYRDRDHVFILSVSGAKTIEYAALFGPGDEGHGRVNFEQSLPERLLRDLLAFLRR